MDFEFPLSLIQGDSLGNKIACELRLRIISGKIARGSKLSENQIANEFGTSRAPVREALKVLANEGLIQLKRMGFEVLGLTKKDMNELYDVRFLIELFACERLATIFGDEKSTVLNQIIDKMELAAKHNNYIDFSSYDMEFHDTIIRFCEHNRILNLWNNIRPIIFTALLVATKRRFQEESDDLPELMNLHRRIVSAIKGKDPQHIKEVLKQHYSDTFKTVYNVMFKNVETIS